MFKNEIEATAKKGERTREHLLECALALFRRRGFEQTTMREIAAEAGLSLGAAYYYFPSKESFVLAYYEWTQVEHAERARAALCGATTLSQRIAAVLQTKIDLLRQDRKVLSALFRTIGDPADALSVFSKETAEIRKQSMGLFDEALGEEALPAEVRELVVRLLWLTHLGLILYFLHDRSPRQIKTQALSFGVAGLLARAVPLLAFPGVAPLRAEILDLARAAGLLSLSTPKERA